MISNNHHGGDRAHRLRGCELHWHALPLRTRQEAGATVHRRRRGRRHDGEGRRGRAAEVYGWVATKKLVVTVGHAYPLHDAAQARIDLESRKTMGKLRMMKCTGDE
ncbi:putative quinone oxidoreductase [Leptomonas seymouri]|uniref:Putative quinone oxidoreductase n=1 Tax=Leptomonas seymouri TaxID=5684 RepID=A0A0N1IJK7_LEPSE|nr:putative quinone oxidoreductase [Leptomonas seymouri]|eukprot:KPI85213.1 putative quinone oxidoreductase [Leptomonas seymouri]